MQSLKESAQLIAALFISGLVLLWIYYYLFPRRSRANIKNIAKIIILILLASFLLGLAITFGIGGSKGAKGAGGDGKSVGDNGPSGGGGLSSTVTGLHITVSGISQDTAVISFVLNGRDHYCISRVDTNWSAEVRGILSSIRQDGAVSNAVLTTSDSTPEAFRLGVLDTIQGEHISVTEQ